VFCSSLWCPPSLVAYPVASCNEQDFYNLIDVYMDAVFYPNLTPDTLAQEGHHLELEEGGTAKDVKISGVVRNEVCFASASLCRAVATEILRWARA
jgi:presequence protease